MYYVFRPSVGYNCVKKILVGATTISSKEQIHCEFNMCVCVCVLSNMQRATILPCVASLFPPYFSTLSHKRHDFREKVIKNKMCILIFSTTFMWNSAYSKKNSMRCCRKIKYVYM